MGVSKKFLSLFVTLAGLGSEAALAAESCAAPTLACASVNALLGQREGYGRGATGGLDGVFVTVNTNADNPNGKPVGEGLITLRDAITRAKGPTWINFAADMDIRLSPYKYLAVPSNITIDGRGRKIAIYGNGFQIVDAKNVILSNLTLNGGACDGTECHTLLNPDGTLFMSPPDGIRLIRSSRVWLNHLDLANIVATGKPIAITRASTDVTISWTIVRSSMFGMIIYDQLDGLSAGDPPRVTIHHSMFVSNTQRHPRLSTSDLHFYNNVVYSWHLYAMSVGAGGRTLTEGNLFFNNKSRACDNILFRETMAGIQLGSPNSCTVPTDPTKAVYCSDFCGAIPYSSGSIFENGDYTGSMLNESGYGYYQLRDNNYQLDNQAMVVGESGYRGNSANPLQKGMVVNHPSDTFAPDYCYGYESGAVMAKRAKAGTEEILAAGGAYDYVLPSSQNLPLPAPIGSLLPNSGNAPRRNVSGVRCPAERIAISFYGATALQTTNLRDWPSSLSFRENSTYPTHHANIYFSLPPEIERKRPASFSLKFQARGVGQRNLQLMVFDSARQSQTFGQAEINLTNGGVQVLHAAGGIRFANVHAIDLGKGLFQVMATMTLPTATRDLRLYFASAGGTVANAAAGVDIQNIRFEPSTPGDDLAPVPSPYNYAAQIQTSFAGAVPVVPPTLDIWPSVLSFREDASTGDHQANVYFSMTSRIQQARPAFWNLSFEVQSVGGRQLNFYLLDSERQSVSYHRLILDPAKGTLSHNAGDGGLVLSDVELTTLANGRLLVKAKATLPGVTKKIRASFATRGTASAAPGGLNIWNYKLEPGN